MASDRYPLFGYDDAEDKRRERIRIRDRSVGLRCPACNATKMRVTDSRPLDNGKAVYRRRECRRCKKRYGTKEEVYENG